MPYIGSKTGSGWFLCMSWWETTLLASMGVDGSHGYSLSMDILKGMNIKHTRLKASMQACIVHSIWAIGDQHVNLCLATTFQAPTKAQKDKKTHVEQAFSLSLFEWDGGTSPLLSLG